MSLSKIDLEKKYLIHVGKKGTFFPDENPLHNTTPQDIDDLFKYLEDNEKEKLLLYFHGGIVSAESGLKTAEYIADNILNETDAHPICFIWKTDFKRTIFENFDIIAMSSVFKKILVKALWLVGNELNFENSNRAGTARGDGNLTEDTIISELEKESPFENYSVSIDSKSANIKYGEQKITPYKEILLKQSLEGQLKRNIEKDTAFENVFSEDLSEKEQNLINPLYSHPLSNDGKGFVSSAIIITGVIKIALNVVKRFLAGTDHDFHPTVVEEVIREIYLSDAGNWVWTKMKNKAEDMWTKDDFSSDWKNWHVGYYFMHKLNEYQQNNNKKLTIDLVGHSAGSIVICNLLNIISNNDNNINFRNIIFLAPACRSDKFNSHLLRNQHLFSSFKCFTMKDEIEKQDKVFHDVYPYSLLYFISGVLEDESDANILGLQRHSTGLNPYNTDVLINISDYLKIDGNSIYSKTDENSVEGFRSTAIAHGGFAENEETMQSIIYIIKQ